MSGRANLRKSGLESRIAERMNEFDRMDVAANDAHRRTILARNFENIKRGEKYIQESKSTAAKLTLQPGDSLRMKVTRFNKQIEDDVVVSMVGKNGRIYFKYPNGLKLRNIRADALKDYLAD